MLVYSIGMPLRNIIFESDHIYHIFNKSVEKKKVFKSPTYTHRFLNTMHYYRSIKAPPRYSNYLKCDIAKKNDIDRSLDDEKSFIVNIYAYCFMPNHYHLLLKQITHHGISKFLANITNSFTRYLNTKEKRQGPIFLPQFKAVEVTSDEQLKHVSRYIHLNPVSSHIVKSVYELHQYKYSSYRTYLGICDDSLINKNGVMDLFDNNVARYRKFVIEQADYQERLEHIKHTYKW